MQNMLEGWTRGQMRTEEQIIMLFHNEVLVLAIIIYAAERVEEKSSNTLWKNRETQSA